MKNVHYSVALAGNPNSGKTTLFNKLVGGREKIGNWPGTTVEKKEGRVRVGDCIVTITDLPGTYSLVTYTLDERIARDFLMSSDSDVVVIVVNAVHLERNLYLVSQLLEEGANIIVSLNMMDQVHKKGISIRTDELAAILKVPVVETVATKGHGVDKLKESVIFRHNAPTTHLRIDYGELEAYIAQLEEVVKSHQIQWRVNSRVAAVRLLENDEVFIGIARHSPGWEAIKQEINDISSAFSEDIESYIVERRYAYVNGLVKEISSHHLTIDERLTISDKIDIVVTNRFFGIPIFLGFMYALFSFVFMLGDPLVKLIDQVFTRLSAVAVSFFSGSAWPVWLGSLVSDGVIAGVGSVVVFLPYLLLLYLGIAFLEDSGYLARAAFVMDRLMHALGLHGKSFIPMLIGFGCNVPGIMAARTLESQKDRIITILILPLMSCSARLTVYTLFAGALFPNHQGLVVFSLYFLGIITAIIVARIFKKIFFKEESIPLVMELPSYRWPSPRNLVVHMWFRSVYFIKKAGTVIFLAVVIIWLLASFPTGVEYASKQSYIGRVGVLLEPVLKPAGFGFWQAGVALCMGIVAKEVMIGTLGTLYGVKESGLIAVLQNHFTPLTGYAFLIMTLFYIPCVATIAAIFKETNARWGLFAIAYTLILGWILSVVTYQVGSLFL